MARRRARATMPTRRMRLPAPAKRRWNHWVRALPGCKLSHLPCELHEQRARSLVAGFTDALIDSAVAAGVGGGRKSQAASDLAPVGKAPPTEQFLIQDPGPTRPDRAQSGELCHHRVAARRDRLAPCRLQRLHLLLDQHEPRTLALNLGPQVRQDLLTMVAPPARPIAPADAARPEVVQHQQ